MPRGLPDYYNPDTLVSQRLANVEEVVTAIQGIANLDNRGRTLYYDHFSEGVNGWYKQTIGDGVRPYASTKQAEIEPASFTMDAGTDSGGGITIVEKAFLIQDIRSAGLEIGFGYRPNGAVLTTYFSYDNGSLRILPALIVDPDAKTISIMDGADPVIIYTISAAVALTSWIPIKMVVDFATPAYVRLLVGQEQFDISAYTPPSAASLLKGDFYARFVTNAIDDGINIAYIGHVTITIDEP